jgi:hypothetical protein
MPYRTVADGDGTPCREYFAPDPDEQLDELRNEIAYEKYIDGKLDEWKETGKRPSVLPYRRNRA